MWRVFNCRHRDLYLGARTAGQMSMCLSFRTCARGSIESRDAVQRGLSVPTGKSRVYDSEEDLDEATRRNAELYKI